MPEPKKDAKFFCVYLDNKVHKKLEEYCADTGLTKTKAVERILEKEIDNYFTNNKKGEN